MNSILIGAVLNFKGALRKYEQKYSFWFPENSLTGIKAPQIK